MSALGARVAAALLVLAGAATCAAQAYVPVPPIGAGPFPVACSNVEQDFTRLLPGESPDQYWEGVPRDGESRYVTELFRDPAGALALQVRFPDRRELFARYADEELPYALIVCYPTDPSNARANYVLPNGLQVPRMQRGTEPPIWPETFTASRWPVLYYAHGVGGSPLGNGYLETLTLFATYGYVVVAPFNADARLARIRIEDLGDLAFVIRNFDQVVEAQAARPVALSQTLDYLFSHPHWRDRLDPARIGGFGASLGGESMLLAAGAKLTTSVGQSSQQVIVEPRLKAAVGYVPYFGHRVLPAFGEDQSGLDAVSMPYLGIAGTDDRMAPIEMVEQGMNRLQGSRFLVALDGVEHGLVPGHIPDIFTWSLVFLDAFVNDNPAARARIAVMTSVAGGAEDSTLIDYAAPLPPVEGERTVLEFYAGGLDHYFITAEEAEAQMLDAGVLVPGWRRTGLAFKQFAAGDPRGLPVCRFFGTPGLGPSSHFYTVDAYECDVVRANPGWTSEGIAFSGVASSADACAEGFVPVYRIYNQGKGGEANHRYTTSRSSVAQMRREGWLLEGTVFCGLP